MRFNNVIDKALLQNMLKEFMTWHAAMLDYILEIKKHPAMAMAIRLSDLNEKTFVEERRQLFANAKQRLKDGALLAEQKELGEINWDDMSATEQHLVEDFETKKLERDYEATKVKKPRYMTTLS